MWKVDDELHGVGGSAGVGESCSSSFLDSSRLSPPPRAKNLAVQEEEEDKVQLSASLLESQPTLQSRREPE